MTHMVHELQLGPLEELKILSRDSYTPTPTWCFGTAAIVRPRALPRDDTNTSAPDVWNNHTPGYNDLQHLCSSGKCA